MEENNIDGSIEEMKDTVKEGTNEQREEQIEEQKEGKRKERTKRRVEERVQKLIAAGGYCSRRKAEELIVAGRVAVNGTIVSIGATATRDDLLTVDKKPIVPDERIYLIFNKPVGCVTAVTDAHEKTVMDYIDIKERVFPVGRLDKDTSGLLILTNDGELTNKITHPSYEVKKIYRVRLNSPIRDSELRRVERGVLLEDGQSAPARVVRLKGSEANNPEVEITIHEGRNRIVRRIFEAIGYEVVALQRVRINNVVLEGIPLGRYKSTTKEVIERRLFGSKKKSERKSF